MMNNKIINALTFDVEDYFQVSAFENAVDRKNWDNFPLRVNENTVRILDLLQRYNIKATFFILGWVAERDPGLVKEIQRQGHEIACHGYSHKLVYSQSKDEFFEETRKSKDLLEDITGEKVAGYRAASYSITRESLWAVEHLIELGFEYDSSIFPVRHDRYGIVSAPRDLHKISNSNGLKLIEFPLSTVDYFGLRVPVAGGGYFRLLPYTFIKNALKKINSKYKKPFIFYLHPWEMDPDQPRIKASLLSRFRHYRNIDVCKDRLESLLQEYQFSTVRNVIDEAISMKELESFSLSSYA